MFFFFIDAVTSKLLDYFGVKFLHMSIFKAQVKRFSKASRHVT